MEQSLSDASFGPVKIGQEGVAFLVQQTSRAFDAHLSAIISQYGLDPISYKVLRHALREVAVSPQGVPVADLGHKLNMPAEDLADTSRRLERDGWLELLGDTAEVRIVPTKRTHFSAPVLADASRWMHECALNGFSHEEVDQLSTLLKRVARNLGAPLGEDDGPLTV